MGIGKKLLSIVAKDTAIGTVADISAEKTLDLSEKAKDLAEKLEESSKQKLINSFKESPTHAHLVVKSPFYELKEKYLVWDENLAEKYHITGKLISLTHHLSVFDLEGNKLAYIKEKLVALRSPISLDSNPKDFVIEVGGKKLGKIKTKGALLKRKFTISFNDWVVEGDIIGFNYTVLNGKDIVMKVHQKLLSTTDTYILDIYNPEDELICLVIAIVIDASTMTKGKEQRKVISKAAREVRRDIRNKMWL